MCRRRCGRCPRRVARGCRAASRSRPGRSAACACRALSASNASSPPDAPARAAASSSGSSSASLRSRIVQEPSATARSMTASPAAVIRPAARSRSTRALLLAAHTPPLRRRQKYRLVRRSSTERGGSVDPAEAEGFLDQVLVGRSGLAGGLLEVDDEDAVRGPMVRPQPFAPGLRGTRTRPAPRRRGPSAIHASPRPTATWRIWWSKKSASQAAGSSSTTLCRWPNSSSEMVPSSVPHEARPRSSRSSDTRRR